MSYVWVFLGGGLGSICRFLIARILPIPTASFPWPTFWANLISCLILGWLVGQKMQGELSAGGSFFLMTGFCGGFSTFSTFSYEAFSLFEDGRFELAFLYIGLSLLTGLIGIYTGLRLSYFLA